MKRTILFAAVLIGLFISCNKDDILTPDIPREDIKKCSGCRRNNNSQDSSVVVGSWNDTTTTVIIVEDF